MDARTRRRGRDTLCTLSQVSRPGCCRHQYNIGDEGRQQRNGCPWSAYDASSAWAGAHLGPVGGNDIYTTTQPVRLYVAPAVGLCDIVCTGVGSVLAEVSFVGYFENVPRVHYGT